MLRCMASLFATVIDAMRPLRRFPPPEIAIPAKLALLTGALTLGLSGVAAATPAAAAPVTRAAAGGFTARVTNPYFPALPGMRWVYRGTDGGRRLRNVVRVLDRVERVTGVPCAVIDDRVYLDGRLAERTIDWYTQSASGTVWYFGERTAALDRRGRVTTREGSWRAGVDGARAGIFMPAHPRVGQSFVQERYAGHAEDHFTIVNRHATVSVPFRRFRGNVLMTHEFSPLEPGVLDGKWYARGIGQVLEASIKGGNERAELVSFRRGTQR